MKHADILIWYARKELSVQVKHVDILIRYARKNIVSPGKTRGCPYPMRKKYFSSTAIKRKNCLIGKKIRKEFPRFSVKTYAVIPN